MSYYDGTADQITINTKGSAESQFTQATFSASITRHGKTGPAAKEAARPIIEALKAVIVKWGADAQIDLDRMSTTFAVAPHQEYENNRHVHRGYDATYTIAFSCSKVVEALKVHDAMTSIEGVNSPTPVFHMDNQGEVAAKVPPKHGKYGLVIVPQGDMRAAGFADDPANVIVVPGMPHGRALLFVDDRPEENGMLAIWEETANPPCYGLRVYGRFCAVEFDSPGFEKTPTIAP